MTALIVIGIIVAVIVAIARLRFGAEAEYSEDGFALIVHVGPLGLKLLPKKPKPPGKENKKKEKKKKTDSEDGEAQKPKKGGSVDLVLKALPVVADALGRFRRRFLINDLTVYYMAASTDPAKAALTFGRSSMVLGIVMPLLENTFRVRHRDVQTGVSFDETKPYIYIHARFSLSVGDVFYMAWGLVKFAVFEILLKKDRKVAEKNGQTSNRGHDGDNDAEDTGDGGR